VARAAHDLLLPTHVDNCSLSRTLRDAIERKAIEDALCAEKEHSVVTLNSIGDALLRTLVSGDTTYPNPLAETVSGWCREEVIGKPLAEVFYTIEAPHVLDCPRSDGGGRRTKQNRRPVDESHLDSPRGTSRSS
jgi:PAS domain-containing protein